MAARVQMQNTNMADYRMYQVPPRRPVGGTRHAGLQFQPSEASPSQQRPPHPHPHPQPQQRLAPNYDQQAYSHQRNRTTSYTAPPAAAQYNNRNNAFNRQAQHAQPAAPPAQATPPPAAAAAPPLAAGPVPTRTLSNATASTSSTGGNRVTTTTNTMSTTSSADIHRSASSRSANAPLSYVALMRRQKGTVWCDRAQPEDPRLQAQKRAQKQRAYLELHGSSGRSSTFASSGKIRHTGKTAPTFSPSTLVGATVPTRLITNEFADDEGDDHSSEGGLYHRRTGSARSSLGSMHRYPSGYQRPQGKTPPNEQAYIPEVAETSAAAPPLDAAAALDSANASLTSSHQDFPSQEQDSQSEHDFGNISEMGAPAAANTAMQKAKKADDLRRRGSVDDRTTSLTGVRLFVANPDADD